MSQTSQTSSEGWRQLWGGIVTGIVAVVTVFAGVLLASQEMGGPTPTSVAQTTPGATVTASPTSLPATSPVPLTASPTRLSSSATPGPTATPEQAVACAIPFGWSAYTVQTGDSLESIAFVRGTNIYVLIQGNCLVNPDVTPGQTLYLPPAPTRSPGPTPTRVPCGPPINWVIYRVRPGDTLYGLAVRYGTTVNALAQANCLTGYMLRVGQPLYVPPVIVVPPTWTLTRVPSVTPPSPSATVPSVEPSLTPSATASVAPASPTVAPNVTPVATDTPLPPTPTPTVGVTPSPPPTPTNTLPPTSISPLPGP